MKPGVWVHVILTAALLLGVAGCSGLSLDGASGPVLPRRPAELGLDGLQPCALLDGAQLARLGLSEPGFSRRDVDGSAVCQWLPRANDSNAGQMISMVTRHGVTHYLVGQRQVEAVTIGDYGAVQTTGALAASDQDNCLVLVDVAQGQTLYAFYHANTMNGASTSWKQSCTQARPAVEAALATLKSFHQRDKSRGLARLSRGPTATEEPVPRRPQRHPPSTPPHR